MLGLETTFQLEPSRCSMRVLVGRSVFILGVEAHGPDFVRSQRGHAGERVFSQTWTLIERFEGLRGRAIEVLEEETEIAHCWSR